MFLGSLKIKAAFINSGTTVGLRAFCALGAFVLIIREADASDLAVYGIASFFWAIIFNSSQNFGAQPLVDLPRIRSNDVASARVLVLAVATALSLVIVLCSPFLTLLYPQIDDLDAGISILLWLGPLSTVGAVDFALKQRLMDFRFIARAQTLAVLASSLIAWWLAQQGHVVLGLLAIQGLAGPIFSLLSLVQSFPRVWGRVRLESVRRVTSIGRHLVLEANLAVFTIHGPVALLGLFLPVAQLSLFVISSRFIQLIASQLARVGVLVLLPLVRRTAHCRNRLHGTVMTVTYFSNGLVIAPLIGMFTAPIFVLSLLNAPTDTYAVSVHLLLIGKQILDAAGNTVFSIFRSIGRPDTGWKWSLLFSFIWLALAAVAWAASLDLLEITQILLLTGTLSFGAMIWLCRVLKLPILRYARQVGPVFILAAICLALSRPVVAILESFGLPDPVTELLGAISIVLLYLGLLVINFFLLFPVAPDAEMG